MTHHDLAFLMQRLVAEDSTQWITAACQNAEPDLFFPVSASARNVGRVEVAKAVCVSCLVRRECLEYAVSTQQVHRVWGGMTKEERYRVISANRRRAEAPAAIAQAR